MGRSPPEPPPAAPARPLRLRLLLLAAGGMLPLVLLLGWGVNHIIEEQRAAAYRNVLELSRALGTAVDTELHSVQAVLDTLAMSDELEQADLRSFHQLARRTSAQLGWRQLIVADGQGRVLMRSADPFGTVTRPALDEPSLRRVLDTRAPAVSRVVPSPVTGQDAFAVRVPVLRSGQVVYVLSAVLPTEMVLRVLTRQDIPAGSVATVLDQTGHRVARSRPSPAPAPSPSLQALLAQGAPQGVGITQTVEGVDSYTGYTRLPGSGWVVAVGTSVTAAERGLHGLTLAVIVGLAASLALAGMLSWLMGRRVVGPIESLAQAATALGRGEPVAVERMDIEELRRVAQALQDAAVDRDRAATERETLTARLQEALRLAEAASRSKDEFLAMLGHELRNPLAPIATAVQVMALKGDAATAPERHIIERQLVHVTRLVDDLLDISRITSRRLAIRREPVPAGALIAQVVEALRPSLHERDLVLEMDPAAAGAWVQGDEVRLVQVFNNLLVNAIKFTRAGGRIGVRVRLDGPWLCAQVEDDGAGIAPDDLERIFDLFYQAPQSADRSRGGLGLGLPIVRSLVEMQGGDVSAASAGPGRGSCFSLRLPLCESPPPQAAPPAAAPGVPRQVSVLVVDDNEDAADTCASFLDLHGLQVRVAYDPAEALACLAQARFDVAVLDIGLPGMSGYELAARMRAAGYAGRLVALTGYGQETDKALSLKQGFDAHLTKPVAPPELLELLLRLAAERAPAA